MRSPPTTLRTPRRPLDGPIECHADREESVRNASACGRDEHPRAGGLAPAAARDWLAIHEIVAWHPERVTGLLRAGTSPARIAALGRRAGTGGAGKPQPRRSSFDSTLDHTLDHTLDRMIVQLERIGARVVPVTHCDYPARLELLRDAPPLLLVRGDVAALQAPGIAIVGARAATQLARRTARRLARDLAQSGFAIVSGLARGIDAEAHRGALEAGGRTLAVLACGPERIYPPEHRRLADEILERGAVTSELPVGSPPRPAHFPLRNRLISGLSIAVIVVEARRRSGSLITVRHALDQGREVFVVPGAVDGPHAEGSNQLLREGARAIRGAEDVLEDLGVRRVEAAPMQAELGLGSPPRARSGASDASPADVVLSLLAEGPLDPDDLARRSGLEPGSLAHVLVELELAGRIQRERDGRIRRAWR